MTARKYGSGGGNGFTTGFYPDPDCDCGYGCGCTTGYGEGEGHGYGPVCDSEGYPFGPIFVHSIDGLGSHGKGYGYGEGPTTGRLPPEIGNHDR